MESQSPAKIAEEWIQKWSTGKPTNSNESVLDWELPRKQPDLCLAAIVEVLDKIDSTAPNELLGLLAAGPLETLLSHNGEASVDQVDLLARRDPRFRLLLNGVWDSGINTNILDRLAKYRSNRW